MKNYRSTLTVILKAAGLSLLLFLLAQALLALLAVRGTLPEERTLAAQTASMALTLLPGGIYAARRSGLGPLPGALVTALCLCAVLALLGVLLYDGLAWCGETGVLLLGAAAGGVLAGILGSGGKKRKRKKRAIAGK